MTDTPKAEAGADLARDLRTQLERAREFLFQEFGETGSDDPDINLLGPIDEVLSRGALSPALEGRDFELSPDDRTIIERAMGRPLVPALRETTQIRWSDLANMLRKAATTPQPARAEREIAHAIADGFSNGNEQYAEASEPQQGRYDMAAKAVIALRHQAAPVQDAGAECDRLRAALVVARRIAFSGDHETSRLVDLQDHIVSTLSQGGREHPAPVQDRREGVVQTDTLSPAPSEGVVERTLKTIRSIRGSYDGDLMRNAGIAVSDHDAAIYALFQSELNQIERDLTSTHMKGEG